MGLWTKNSHYLQSESSQSKISKFQKMEKIATFLTLLLCKGLMDTALQHVF